MHVLDELQARGFIKQAVDPDGLRKRMDEGPIVFYAGFDPTADSLHVGHLLPIMMMGHLQRAGHRPIAVVGGGTGMVGDPSGKTEARMLLDAAAIAHNVGRLREQIGRVLDLSPGRGELVDNAEWLLELRYIDFLREIGSCFSVNKMLTAEGYRMRLERGLSFIEFNYQLLQAYDFLVLHDRKGCQLQLGGDDQWGNILAGVDLIRRKSEGHAFALTLPLLTTATGEKMGKTHGGAVWLSADRLPVFDFYQYWLNVDDRDVIRLMKLFTWMPLDEIAGFESVTGADLREVKHRLALEVTTILHGGEAAATAQAAARAMAAGAATDDLPTHAVSASDLDAGVLLANVLRDAGLAASTSEARRLLQSGGVRLDQAKVEGGEKAMLTAAQVPAEGAVLRVGKSKAVRLVRG